MFKRIWMVLKIFITVYLAEIRDIVSGYGVLVEYPFGRGISYPIVTDSNGKRYVLTGSGTLFSLGSLDSDDE